MSIRCRPMTRFQGLVFLIPLLIGSLVSRGAAHADMLGLWSTEENKSHVRIERCGETLCGTLAWLEEPNDDDGEPKRDKFNKDIALQSRPITGIRLIQNLIADGDGNCCKGRIYNPEDGNTYRSKLTLVDDDTLKVEGCFLIFCKGQVWQRVE